MKLDNSKLGRLLISIPVFREGGPDKPNLEDHLGHAKAGEHVDIYNSGGQPTDIQIKTSVFAGAWTFGRAGVLYRVISPLEQLALALADIDA